MKKLWGILVGLSMTGVTCGAELVEVPEEWRHIQEWQHIVDATKKITTDKEMQRAVQRVGVELQNMLSLGVKKIAHEISPAEKAKVVLVIQLLHRMVEVFGQAAHTGALDGESADEIRQLGQTFMMVMSPLLALTQDPLFVAQQEQMLKNIRMYMYDNVKRTMEQLNHDIQSVQ